MSTTASKLRPASAPRSPSRSPRSFSTVGKELGPRLAAVEQRHVVAAGERRFDDVPAEELRAAEHQNLHTLQPMSLRDPQRRAGRLPRVTAVVDEWWGGRQMAAMLPKLFFVHFRDTSFVAEDDGGLAGFLCGFRSQTFPDEAYVHFVGVDPARRGSGLGRELYERFFAAVAPRTIVRAVTSTGQRALGRLPPRDRLRGRADRRALRRPRRAARAAGQAPCGQFVTLPSPWSDSRAPSRSHVLAEACRRPEAAAQPFAALCGPFVALL